MSESLNSLLVEMNRLFSLSEHDVSIRDSGLHRLTRFSKGIVNLVHRNRDNLSSDQSLRFLPCSLPTKSDL